MDTIQGEAIDVLGPIGAMARAERARQAQEMRKSGDAGGTLEQRVMAAHQAARKRDGAWQAMDGRMNRLRANVYAVKDDPVRVAALLGEAETLFASVRDAAEASLPVLLAPFQPAPPPAAPLTGANRLAIMEGRGFRLSVGWDGALHVTPASKLTPRVIEEIEEGRDLIVAELVRRADVFVIPPRTADAAG